MNERESERRVIAHAAAQLNDPWLHYVATMGEPGLTPAAWRDALELAESVS